MRSLKILLPLGFAVHLGITFWRTEAASAGRIVEFSPFLLGLALLLAFLPWVTNSLRLWNWLRWVGTPRPLRDCLKIVVASEIGAAVSPTSVGSASVKTAMLVRQGVAYRDLLRTQRGGAPGAEPHSRITQSVDRRTRSSAT